MSIKDIFPAGLLNEEAKNEMKQITKIEKIVKEAI